jgi:hypothetical protein
MTMNLPDILKCIMTASQMNVNTRDCSDGGCAVECDTCGAIEVIEAPETAAAQIARMESHGSVKCVGKTLRFTYW